MRKSPVYHAAFAAGWIIGYQEGQREACRRILLALGERCFGRASARVRKLIASMTELGHLEALCLKVRHAKDWQDLLAEAPPNAPRPNFAKES